MRSLMEEAGDDDNDPSKYEEFRRLARIQCGTMLLESDSFLSLLLPQETSSETD